MFNEKEYMKQWYLDHKEERKEYEKHRRIQLNINYPGYMKEYKKQWHLAHKESQNEKSRQWSLVHKEEKAESNKQWHQNHKETENEKSKRWRLDHKEEFSEYHKQLYINNSEYYKQYQKQYYQTPEGKISKQRSDAKRRAQGKKIINTLTAQEWIDILKEYKFKCAYCGKEFTLFDKATKDHIIPISKGGHNIKENIVPACRSCNSKKHNKLIYKKEVK